MLSSVAPGNEEKKGAKKDKTNGKQKRTKDNVELRKQVETLQDKVFHYERVGTRADGAHFQGLKMRIATLEDQLEDVKKGLAAQKARR